MSVPLVNELNGSLREGVGLGEFSMTLVSELVLLFKMSFHSALFAESGDSHVLKQSLL